MGKEMKAGKKPKSPNRIVLNRSAMRDLKEEATDDVAIMFSVAYMDECCFDEETGDYYPDTDERIVALWTRLARYSKAMDEHLISKDRVRRILKEHGGIDIKKTYK